MSAGKKFRNALKNNKPLIIPGTINAYSAILAEKSGHQAIYLSGGGVAAASYGIPDLGITSLEDVLTDVKRITNASSLPLLVDIDTGWGGAFNISRTIKSMIDAGCGAVHIEDQVSQKRCGHRPNKSLVTKEEMQDRIKAAVDGRHDESFFIMARTDANHTHGLSEAIARAQKFYELGADILFVEAPKNKDEMKTICKEVPGFKIANIVEGGITPNLPMMELADIGYKLAVYPLTVMSSAMKAMTNSLNLLMKDEARSEFLLDFKDLRQRVGFDDYYEISSKYETSKSA